MTSALEFEPSHKKNNNLGFRPGLTHLQSVQSQKQARYLKFQIYIEEGLYYPCRENIGADQPCSYCTADLRLCFCICRLLVFWCCGSFTIAAHLAIQ